MMLSGIFSNGSALKRVYTRAVSCVPIFQCALKPVLFAGSSRLILLLLAALFPFTSHAGEKRRHPGSWEVRKEKFMEKMEKRETDKAACRKRYKNQMEVLNKDLEKQKKELAKKYREVYRAELKGNEKLQEIEMQIEELAVREKKNSSAEEKSHLQKKVTERESVLAAVREKPELKKMFGEIKNVRLQMEQNRRTVLSDDEECKELLIGNTGVAQK